ncbi:hypothetical protein BofuT4_uP113350.1 [Botrytis cinerea T4]|uniref:Uncharacterized protein n=1 Tax=Botryotinia fuckeliana (strain T4) TaxID=999810 RepID=G2Y5T5_BOTF4|nr:hypothetical protein BofuT4_uP113350.1 [Botrytis cinerea T4]
MLNLSSTLHLIKTFAHLSGSQVVLLQDCDHEDG